MKRAKRRRRFYFGFMYYVFSGNKQKTKVLFLFVSNSLPYDATVFAGREANGVEVELGEINSELIRRDLEFFHAHHVRHVCVFLLRFSQLREGENLWCQKMELREESL